MHGGWGMKILLHADDAAGTSSGNAGILDAWQAGRLDGFSIFANGEALHELRSRLLLCPKRARLMAHLNLSEGPSCAAADTVPLLVDEKGELKHGFGSLLLSWLAASSSSRRELERQIELEWHAQIKKIADAISPRQLAGVDGHIHIHMLPFLFPIAAKLANEFSLGSVRVVREPFHRAASGLGKAAFPKAFNVVKHLILRACANPASAVAIKHGLRFPSRVVGVLYSGCMTKGSALAAIASSEKAGAADIELIFHVGRATQDEMARWGGRAAIAEFNISPARDIESAQLSDLHAELVAQGRRNEAQDE